MAYCDLCSRPFSDTALQQHIRDALRHKFHCHPCRRHFKTQSALDQHRLDSPRHHICKECGRDFDTEGERVVHEVWKHNLCVECNKYFASTNNLRGHLRVHMEKTVKCFGCDRMFISKSAMVLHLEQGTCASGADRHLVSGTGTACLATYLTEYRAFDAEYPFKCAFCDEIFRFMSGVLQHIETDRCDAEMTSSWMLVIFLDELATRVRAGR